MPKHKQKSSETERHSKIRKLSPTESSKSSSHAADIDFSSPANVERNRLGSVESWRKWGPYLSERHWGTVREDHSIDGSCWDYFPHNDAIFRAYEYGEDGLLGICDDQAQLCLSLALWNGKDAFLKERLFGLTGPQGNHGEDVKELYNYLDSTPTHSYMKALYKYPQSAFPYQELLEENSKRTAKDPEYEILDTGVFDDNAYWDLYAEYAKASSTDILCKYTVHNRGKDSATIHILPTLWYRNTWSRLGSLKQNIPSISQKGDCTVECSGIKSLGNYSFSVEQSSDNSESTVPFLFTNNETNMDKLKTVGSFVPPAESANKFYKDGINEYVVNQKSEAINNERTGTKCSAWYKLTVEPGKSAVIRCRLYSTDSIDSQNKRGKNSKLFDKSFTDIMKKREFECDAFYKTVCCDIIGDEALIIRQALAGLCWSKQYYCFNGQHNAHKFIRSLASRKRKDSDSGQSVSSAHSLTVSSIISLNVASLNAENREEGEGFVSRRNIDWSMMQNSDIISMPDKWEFPWYATWDLAFHMIPFSLIDIEFAKSQLLLLLSDRYMHPRGQLPAYEFDFSDVNPPVHAWACLKIYRQSIAFGDSKQENMLFLKRCFSKLVVNFTWWVNQKDKDGSFLYEGGFLGMDNVSCLHRSELPKGCRLIQADSTAWMAFYSLCMLDIALEIAQLDECYEDMAITYLSYFSYIVDNINGSSGLWNSTDGFFYDRFIDSHEVSHDVRIHCMIGLVSLFPVLQLTEDRYRNLPHFTKHLNTVISSVTRGRLTSLDDVSYKGSKKSVLLSLVSESQLTSLLHYMLDEQELLSDYGIRALSKAYSGENAYNLSANDQVFTVSYDPGESSSSMFGGNSNWRGTIWLCMNYLILESLDSFGSWYGDGVKVPLPTKSDNNVSLNSVTLDLRRRLISIFTADSNGCRSAHGEYAERYARDPNFKDLVLFYEYFNGDNGAGCGASHQTGWTALVACLILQYHNQRALLKC